MPYLSTTIGSTARSHADFTKRSSEASEQSDLKLPTGQCDGLPALTNCKSLVDYCSSLRRNRCARKKYNKDLQNFLSSALHEPLKNIERLLDQNKKYLAKVEQYRNRHQSRISLRRHLSSFSFDQQSEFHTYCENDERSRLLVSFHFGDFIYGNNLLADHELLDRQQHFLTQLNSTTSFLHNMRCSFGAEKFARRQQLTMDSATPVQLVSLLRQPRSSLLTFADLPQGFGERIAVRFLGRTAWFPKGPATLSLVSKAPILPVLNYWDGKVNRIQLAAQLEPFPQRGESRQDSIARITQTLAEILEGLVRHYPWQWRFLSALPSFFFEGEGNAPLTLNR